MPRNGSRGAAPPAGDRVGQVLDAIDGLSQLGGWASVACIGGILVLIASEVTARSVFNYSIDFAWEFSAYLSGAAFMLGAGYSLRAGAQIRVNVLLDNLSAGPARALDMLATACAAVVTGYLTAALGQLAWLSWTRNSVSIQPSEMPLWIPQSALALGALVLTLQAAARLARLARGEPGDDRRLRFTQDGE